MADLEGGPDRSVAKNDRRARALRGLRRLRGRERMAQIDGSAATRVPALHLARARVHLRLCAWEVVQGRQPCVLIRLARAWARGRVYVTANSRKGSMLCQKGRKNVLHLPFLPLDQKV